MNGRFVHFAVFSIALGLLSYANVFVASIEAEHESILGQLALIAMAYSFGQTVLSYGASGYVVYLRGANLVENLKRLALPYALNAFVVLAILLAIAAATKSTWQAHAWPTATVIALFGVLSAALGAAWYLRDQPIWAAAAERSNVWICSVCIVVLVLTGFGSDLRFLFISFSLLWVVCSTTLIRCWRRGDRRVARSGTAECGEPVDAGSSPSFLFHCHLNSVFAYAYLYLDQLVISHQFGLELLGKYFLAIQVVSLLKFIPTQASRLMLRELSTGQNTERLSAQYACASLMSYLLAAIAVSLAIESEVLPTAYVFLKEHWGNILAIGFVTGLGVLYNQRLVARGLPSYATYVNAAIFLGNIVGVLGWPLSGGEDPVEYFLLLKVSVGLVGQVLLLVALRLGKIGIGVVDIVYIAFGAAVWVASLQRLEWLAAFVLSCAAVTMSLGWQRARRINA